MTATLALLLIATAVAAQIETIYGPADVRDADTIVVADQRVRLIGIDAPEGAQTCELDGREWPCGREAAAWVRATYDGLDVTCEVHGRDRWGRAIAECFSGRESVNAAIVRHGWALAWYPRRGVKGPTFDADEAAARAAGAGIHAGDFLEPWEWRRQR